MKKYKCYTGNYDGLRRGLVIATSQKKAAEIASTPLSSFRDYWGASENIPPLNRETLYTCTDYRGPWVEGICELPERL